MTYDICAYTNKVWTATCSNADYLSVLVGLQTALLDGGWSELPDGSFISQQAPWLYGATPDYYSGRVRVKLGREGQNLTIQAGNLGWTVVQDGMYLNKIVTRAGDFRVQTGLYKIIVNPYQFAMFLPITQDWPGMNQLGVLVSTLQVPRFVQTKMQLVDAIIGIPLSRSSLTHSNDPDTYFLHFSSQSGGSYARSNESRSGISSFIILYYGISGAVAAVPGAGDPLISSPFVCWGMEEGTKATIQGFLWDTMVVGKSAVGDSTFTLDSHNWINHTNNNNNGTLAFVTGGIS